MRPPILPDDPRPDAGFWPRSVAWLLDAGLLLLPLLAGLLLRPQGLHLLAQRWRQIGVAMGQQMQASIAAGGDFITFQRSLWQAGSPLCEAVFACVAAFNAAIVPPLLLFLLLALLLWPLCESGPWQATPGKRCLGLVSCRADGARLSWGEAMKRHLAGGLSWLSLNIGHAMAAGGQHRALHDRLAGSRVLWREGQAKPVPLWGWGLWLLSLLLPLVFLGLAMRALQQALASSLV